jgi:hypothetical protein
MSATLPPPLIGPERAALIGRRVSVIVASRDAAHRPHLMRAVGRRLSADLRRVTMSMAAASSAAVLAGLRANGLIAVVFSEPSTHRTVPLKGSDAVVAAIESGDETLVQTYRIAPQCSIHCGLAASLPRGEADPFGWW